MKYLRCHADAIAGNLMSSLLIEFLAGGKTSDLVKAALDEGVDVQGVVQRLIDARVVISSNRDRVTRIIEEALDPFEEIRLFQMGGRR